MANEAGLSQSLNINQLAMVMARPAMPHWNIRQIIESQKKRGVSDSVIEKARDMAEKIKNERGKKPKKPEIVQPRIGRLNASSDGYPLN